ncbi:NAD-dependent epimerase/dehydratase family protein [Acholeplasma hippikon]|nr:NAD-dependent epimerase/dehydratase family protein [Acholeplasma hippikon]
MKRILITGVNSFIGTSIENELIKYPMNYTVDSIDMKNNDWKKYDFSLYDYVFHVAGIAHVSNDKKLDDLYYKVNRDLAIETALYAKNSGVKNFIFMSSMIIYGEDNKYFNKKPIDRNSYNPTSAYGKSKLAADLEIQKLQSDSFNVSIIRTPVVYGKGSKGNFTKLQKMAKYFLFVPTIKNQKSMIYIDNLVKAIKKIIDNGLSGVFYPQNSYYVSTVDIIVETRKIMKKKTFRLRILNIVIWFLSLFSKKITKIFGNKYYQVFDDDNLIFDGYSFEETVALTYEGEK